MINESGIGCKIKNELKEAKMIRRTEGYWLTGSNFLQGFNYK